jgi:predicted aldo/keto reductase-like oxidoreductase
MQTRTFGKTGETVSLLGYGCMRFPTKNGKTDDLRTEQQVISAIEAGVNYFDTAYMYSGNEAALGRVLSKGYRDRVFIADKMPPYLVHSQKDMDKILDSMLSRLQTDRIDFFLVHALNDFNGWTRFRDLGFNDFLQKAKAAGKIKHVGFSWHGNKDEFKRVVDDFDWGFCQIQYNYLDENYQAGRDGLNHAAKKGLGIVIMEPLRGGLLVGRLPEKVSAIMKNAPIQRTPAAWAFDWLYDQPEIHVVLSGMNDEKHIEENLKIVSTALPGMFTERDKKIAAEIKKCFRDLLKVDCTGCGYCMPCPFGVDIPGVFSYYNSMSLFKNKSPRFHYTMFMAGLSGGKPSNATLCTKCGKCEKRCPQHIPIPAKLAESHKALNVGIMKPVVSGLRFYMKMKGKRKKEQ